MKTNGTKKFTKIPIQTSVYMSYLYHHGQVSISEIVKMYPYHAPRSIYRHYKQKATEKVDNRKFNSRPNKPLARHERLVVRRVGTMWGEVGKNFGLKKVQSKSVIDHACDRTIQRCLNKNGYFNSSLRKKGIVTAKDCKNRRSFSQKCLKNVKPDFCTKCVSFYLDGVGFTHKHNLVEDAKSSESHG